MARCPACGKGELHRGKVREQMFGVDLGEYPAEICDSCGESFVDQKAMRKIEARAKELGLWGLAKKVSIAKSGNSLVVRIPFFFQAEDGIRDLTVTGVQTCALPI